MTQPTDQLTFTAVAFGTLMAGLLLLICLLYRGPFAIRLAAFGSFALHAVLGSTNLLWPWFPVPDQETYHQQGLALAEGRNPPIWHDSKSAWPILLSWMFRWIEPNLQLGVMVNALLCGITVLLVHRTAVTLHPRAGGYTVLLLFLMPSWWVWGSFALREPMVWAICAGIGLCLVHLRRGSVTAALVFLSLCGLLVVVRGPLVLLILGGLAPAMVISSTQRLRGALLGGSVLIGSLVLFSTMLAETAERSTDLELIRNDQARAASGFETGNIVMTLVRVLAGPFPWELPALGLIYIPFGFFAIAILGCALLGIKKIGLRSLWLAGPAGSIVLGLALASGNYGTMMRLRDMATVLILPLAAVGLRAIVGADFWRSTSHARPQDNPQLAAAGSSSARDVTA
ncbi:MAG: hypothetical protein Q4G67_08595 [Actinomycetia bacterium]|nr:hypothetical protein [Actinomycetes bacterium]